MVGFLLLSRKRSIFVVDATCIPLFICDQAENYCDASGYVSSRVARRFDALI